MVLTVSVYNVENHLEAKVRRESHQVLAEDQRALLDGHEGTQDE